MTRYHGLTWDHPRGFNALAFAASRLDEARDGVALSWDRQPLEGFESHPIADLCARFDLVVIDHPHVGEAFEADCILPLEELFGADEIAALERDTIGPCLSSYRYGGRHWALPLDAASQVMALRPDLLGGTPAPATWDAVEALAASRPVALSLAGPHACLTFLSMAVAFGDPPAEADPERLVSAEIGAAVLERMARLAGPTLERWIDLNPIAMLGRMATSDEIALVPLVFGYVNYAAPASGRALAFHDAPAAAAGGRPGSTLGGTGIAVSRRAAVTPGLLDHLRALLGREAQIGTIPAHDGQPSRREAWADEDVNRRWNDFYRNTAATLEAAYVRPRHAGYIAFQSEASATIRAGLAARRPAPAILSDLQDAYAASRRAGAER